MLGFFSISRLRLSSTKIGRQYKRAFKVLENRKVKREKKILLFSGSKETSVGAKFSICTCPHYKCLKKKKHCYHMAFQNLDNLWKFAKGCESLFKMAQKDSSARLYLTIKLMKNVPAAVMTGEQYDHTLFCAAKSTATAN